MKRELCATLRLGEKRQRHRLRHVFEQPSGVSRKGPQLEETSIDFTPALTQQV